VALQDIYNDPDRLTRPVKKTKDGWVEITWKEAFKLVIATIKDIQAKHGNDSVALYQGNPTVHNYGSMLFARGLKKVLKTKNNFSATSVDQLPHHIVARDMFGHPLMIPIPDIDRTDYFLILGANPMVSNGSMMTAPNMPGRLKKIQERGGKVVVIDPRRTETATKSDKHLYIRPGTDVFFLAGLINEILNYPDQVNKMPGYVKGLNSLKKTVSSLTPDQASRITGIKTSELKIIAKEFSSADKAVCYGRLGVSTQESGTLCQWFINSLNIITGNFDNPGGHMFTTPAVPVRFPSKKGSDPLWYSRVRKLPEVIGELPVAAMAEEITTSGQGQVKALICSAGNPVLSTPNGQKLNEALKELDFMVSIDIYINESSRHAHVILPPATGLEVDHYDLIFNALAVRNVAKYSTPLFPKQKGMKYDWQIIKALTSGLKSNKTGILHHFMSSWLTPQRMLSIGLKKGPYFKNQQKLTLNKLKKNPHGIDLGPLMPIMPEGLFTKDHQLNLAPDQYTLEFSKLSLASIVQKPGLKLIGRRHLRSNNSWMHNSHRLVKGPARCTALINSVDAREYGISPGQLVKIFTASNSIQLHAEVTEDIMPGVVSVPHGWGHLGDGIQLEVAKKEPGVSINDLTDSNHLDSISGNAVLSGIDIKIEGVQV